MDESYSNAYCTVIAAATVGLSGVRERPKKCVKDFEGKTFGISWTPKEKYILNLYEWLLESKWASRGWTFQEHILSRRCMIFVDGDCFWSCQSSVWDTGDLCPPLEVGTDDPVELPQHTQLAKLMASPSRPDVGLYIEMASLYNNRNLTFPQDCLVAFCGIMNCMRQSFPSCFVCGLPLSHIDNALLWQPRGKARRRQAKDGSTLVLGMHLPSWPWCGWQCLIDTNSLRAGLADVDHKKYRARAGTWQTESLVEWSAVSEDFKREISLQEPFIPEHFKDPPTNQGQDVLIGHSYRARNTDADHGTFDTVSSTNSTLRIETVGKANHSASLHDLVSPMAHQHAFWPFITCKTSRAFLRVGAVLTVDNWRVARSGIFSWFSPMSVFEMSRFQNAPNLEDPCDIIALEDQGGTPAGQLRHMDDSDVRPGGTIELIAISTGSVAWLDLKSDVEAEVDRTQS